MSGLLRSLDHNEEQVVWAEQTEIELGNFLREFDITVWPMMQAYGYSKDGALAYWMQSHLNIRLDRIATLLEQDRI